MCNRYKGFIVVRKGELGNIIRVGFPLFRKLGRAFPIQHSNVISISDPKCFAVLAEADTPQVPLISLERGVSFSRLHLSQPDGFVRACRGQPFTIGAEPHGDDISRVSFPCR